MSCSNLTSPKTGVLVFSLKVVRVLDWEPLSLSPPCSVLPSHTILLLPFSADIFQLSILPAVPRWLCQCCPPSEFLSPSSPPPSVFSLCPSPSLPSYRLSLFFFSLCLLYLAIPFYSLHLSSFLPPLDRFYFFSFFFQLLLFLSPCCRLFCLLLPPSLFLCCLFFMPYDGFVCQLVSANPWPQYTTIFSSSVSALQTSLVHLHAASLHTGLLYYGALWKPIDIPMSAIPDIPQILSLVTHQPRWTIIVSHFHRSSQFPAD